MKLHVKISVMHGLKAYNLYKSQVKSNIFI